MFTPITASIGMGLLISQFSKSRCTSLLISTRTIRSNRDRFDLSRRGRLTQKMQEQQSTAVHLLLLYTVLEGEIGAS